jgi:hypothetical protein
VKDADGIFVGGCIEKEGWGTAIDAEKLKRYVDLVRSSS